MSLCNEHTASCTYLVLCELCIMHVLVLRSALICRFLIRCSSSPAYLVPMFLYAAFGPFRKCLVHVSFYVGRQSACMPTDLGYFTPTIATVTHLFQELFFASRPWRICSTLLLTAILGEQGRDGNVRCGCRFGWKHWTRWQYVEFGAMGRPSFAGIEFWCGRRRYSVQRRSRGYRS